LTGLDLPSQQIKRPSAPEQRDAAMLWGCSFLGAAFWVAVAPTPAEYEDSEEENCYQKGTHIHRQGL